MAIDKKRSVAISAGMKSGCRFCMARGGISIKVGDRIRILNGFRAGVVGKIVPSPPNFPADMILIQAEGDPPDEQQNVIISKNLFEKLPSPPWPNWAPQISIKELEELDSIVVKFCDKSTSTVTWKPNWPYYFEIIRYIWKNRLPIEPNELWQFLDAHGIPNNWKNRLTTLFKDGRDLLIHVNGRKPIRKKILCRTKSEN